MKNLLINRLAGACALAMLILCSSCKKEIVAAPAEAISTPGSTQNLYVRAVARDSTTIVSAQVQLK